MRALPFEVWLRSASSPEPWGPREGSRSARQSGGDFEYDPGCFLETKSEGEMNKLWVPRDHFTTWIKGKEWVLGNGRRGPVPFRTY